MTLMGADRGASIITVVVAVRIRSSKPKDFGAHDVNAAHRR